MDRWTTRDEAQFNELMERRRRVMNHNREELRRAVDWPTTTSVLSVETVLDHLIERAAPLNRAIQPFLDARVEPLSAVQK